MNGIVLILLLGVCAVVTGAADPSSLYHDEKYVGCFKDDEADRVLDGFYTTLPNMTVTQCLKLCVNHDRKYLYAGLQNGNECYCGDARYGIYGKALSSECETACPGNRSETCGGNLRNEIYRIEYYVYKYVGCFEDFAGQETKVLQDYDRRRDPTVTNGNCARTCFDLNKYDYAGTEFTEQCYCGNQGHDQLGPAPETECNMTCSGNRSEFCGGFNRISVYKKALYNRDNLLLQQQSTCSGNGASLTPTATDSSVPVENGFTDDGGVGGIRPLWVSEKPPTTFDKQFLAFIIGGCVGGIALIMSIIAIVVIVKHRRERRTAVNCEGNETDVTYDRSKTARPPIDVPHLRNADTTTYSNHPAQSENDYEVPKHDSPNTNHVYLASYAFYEEPKAYSPKGSVYLI